MNEARRGAGWWLALIVLALPAWGCQPDTGPGEGAGEGGAAWLEGTVDERFQLVGNQMAGFSATMAEVAYRYEEAYWAVQDRNWPYAHYQAEKMGDAIDRGVIRRPAREASARSHFLDSTLPDFLSALEEGDDDRVMEAWERVVDSCNSCHVAEDVPFIRVGEPETRRSFVQPENPSEE